MNFFTLIGIMLSAHVHASNYTINYNEINTESQHSFLKNFARILCPGTSGDSYNVTSIPKGKVTNFKNFYSLDPNEEISVEIDGRQYSLVSSESGMTLCYRDSVESCEQATINRTIEPGETSDIQWEVGMIQEVANCTTNQRYCPAFCEHQSFFSNVLSNTQNPNLICPSSDQTAPEIKQFGCLQENDWSSSLGENPGVTSQMEASDTEIKQ